MRTVTWYGVYGGMVQYVWGMVRCVWWEGTVGMGYGTVCMVGGNSVYGDMVRCV